MNLSQQTLAGIERLRREGRVVERGGKPTEPLSEKEFMRAVIALAKRHGWTAYHTFDSRKSQAGWPDLVLCRPPVLLYRELKVGDNKPTAAQLNWLDCLRSCGCDVGVWTPADFAEITQMLTSSREYL